jgi:ADP-heptose:LPS heptosyltransferase
MKILLLQLKRIGDLILTTPAIAALRKTHPDAHITLAASNECAELLPAISNIDRVLIARRNLRDCSQLRGDGLRPIGSASSPRHVLKFTRILLESV